MLIMFLHSLTMLIAALQLMVGLGIVLIITRANVWAAATLIALWGFAFGSPVVAWSTWIARMVPDEAESGGALLVASIQLAITIGAAIGGLLLDTYSVEGVITGAVLILFIAALTIWIGLKPATANKGTEK